MHQNSTSRSQSSEGSGHTGRNRPRVVILDEGTSARVVISTPLSTPVIFMDSLTKSCRIWSRGGRFQRMAK